jgi:hypothetical protein
MIILVAVTIALVYESGMLYRIFTIDSAYVLAHFVLQLISSSGVFL